MTGSRIMGLPAPTTVGDLGCAEERVLRIVQDPDGLGMRGLSGRRAMESRSMPLSKAGGPFRTEAGVEPRAAKRHMFDVDVVAILHQPCRFEGVDREGFWTYLPDTAKLYADGRRAIREEKATWRQLETNPAYVRRLGLVADELRRRGWNFELGVAETDGDDKVRQDNIDLMFVGRNTRYGPDQKVRAAALLRASGGVTTLGVLARAVADDPVRGKAIAYSMMADRLVDIDLGRVLSDRSPVRTVRPAVPDLPPLRF